MIDDEALKGIDGFPNGLDTKTTPVNTLLPGQQIQAVAAAMRNPTWRQRTDVVQQAADKFRLQNLEKQIFGRIISQ